MNPEVVKYAIKDKAALALVITLLAVVTLAIILMLFWLRPSDIQIPIRYSGYDNSLYNDRWYERLSFIGFLGVHTAVTLVIGLLLHARGYRVLSYLLMVLGVFVAVCSLVVASAVIRTVTL